MQTADGVTDPREAIASGAWTRLRNLVAALDRVDRLETSSEYDGWLRQLATDDPALTLTLREFFLRVLRTAAEPANFTILLLLQQRGALSTGGLQDALRLSRVELVERLNDLARTGLTAQALDGDQIEATPLALGFLGLVDEISAAMLVLAKSDYLLNPAAAMPAPPPHGRRGDLESQA